ncbi:hypothetical protein [Winogradskyella tangerina]|uniref:hypothetical protein n=1 Tax=Winogradskyella tangerina TaxID=2023240 RepID=UPI000DBE9E0B|nr:hypothetical protein [Winogradskyella tangerina]
MNSSLNINKGLLVFGVPLLLISSVVAIVFSPFFNTHSSVLILAITLDLVITIPLIYFLLIRKTSIPKITAIPLIILGVIIGTVILPEENQTYLNGFKTWILPFIELGILSFVIYKIYKAQQRYKQKKKNGAFDFFTTLKMTCSEILPKAVVMPVVTEISVFYYGFIYWKRRPLKSNEFSYHKNTGTIGLLLVFKLIIAVETVTIHFLLLKWNSLVAYIVTGLSVYTAIQIIGFLKSMIKRPITIDNHKVYLRYGIMNESVIDLDDISSIELSTKEIETNKSVRKLSILGALEPHNTIIHLKTENVLNGLYGIKRSFKVLALHVDKNADFKNYLEDILIQNSQD